MSKISKNAKMDRAAQKVEKRYNGELVAQVKFFDHSKGSSFIAACSAANGAVLYDELKNPVRWDSLQAISAEKEDELTDFC